MKKLLINLNSFHNAQLIWKSDFNINVKSDNAEKLFKLLNLT